MSKRTHGEGASDPQPRKRLKGFRTARQPLQSSSQPSSTSRITTVVSTTRGRIRTGAVKERQHQAPPLENLGEMDSTQVEVAAATEPPPTPTGPSVDSNTKGKRQRGTTHVCHSAPLLSEPVSYS